MGMPDGRLPRRDVYAVEQSRGGGPWGSGGPKGPWGSGPQSSGGSTPPDLEDLLRRSQDKLSTVLPGGDLGGRGLALIAARGGGDLGLLRFLPGRSPANSAWCCALASMCAIRQPGLNYHLPYPIETGADAECRRAINRLGIGMRKVEDMRRGTTRRAMCRKKA